jgi:hypothetical protein
MKKYILIAVTLITLASCKKASTPGPNDNGVAGSAVIVLDTSYILYGGVESLAVYYTINSLDNVKSITMQPTNDRYELPVTLKLGKGYIQDNGEATFSGTLAYDFTITYNDGTKVNTPEFKAEF